MNSEILGEKWHELKGKIQQAFGKLTADDLRQIQGSTDRMVGVLQTRYGYGKEQAQQEWENFARQHVITAEDTYQQMADTAQTPLPEATPSAAKR
jgi:uncharacterized protein YjbJ (UPF0337 family)